jgi:hypothetical protein
MRAFEYIDDGETIRMIDGFKVFQHLDRHVYNTENVLVIKCVNSFGLILVEIKNQSMASQPWQKGKIIRIEDETSTTKKFWIDSHSRNESIEILIVALFSFKYKFFKLCSL